MRRPKGYCARRFKELKRMMRLNSTSLDTKDILNALASSAVSEKNAVDA